MTSSELAKLDADQIRAKARRDMSAMFIEYCQLTDEEFDAIIMYAQISSAHLLALIGHNALLQDETMDMQKTYETLAHLVGRELKNLDEAFKAGESMTVEDILNERKQTDDTSKH